VGKVGRFNPPIHRGVDVFASPGSRVHVPYRSELTIVRATFDPEKYKGQAFGWITVCGRRYGFVCAHLAVEPELGDYDSGDVYGHVAGRVPFTPHAHIAMARDHIPPPGDVDPVKVWERCVESEG
jgi:hypothetical protein